MGRIQKVDMELDEKVHMLNKIGEITNKLEKR